MNENMRTKKDILSTYVGLLKTQSGYDTNGNPVCMNVPLKYILYDVPLMNKDWLDYVVSLPYHSKEQEKAKSKTPRYYISGMFDMTEFNYGRFPIHDYPIKGSNLMTIDIDAKDNPDIDIWKIREEIFKLPYVFSCLKSVSGKGFYCIIPIEDTKYTKEYYNYIIRLWKQKYNITVDDNAASLIRARIISYNEDIDNWLKEEVEVWNIKYTEPIKKEESAKKEEHYSKYNNTDTTDWNYLTEKAMELVINDGYYVKGYNAWYHLACELKTFDRYDLFIKASNNVDYNDSIDKIKKKWDNAEPVNIDNDLIRKWCGMARNRIGKDWIKQCKNI